MNKVIIEWQDHQQRWRYFSTFSHEATAYRFAASRCKTTGKRHRLVNEQGQLIDMID